MNVLHCTWIPEPATEFVQSGDFWLWIETAEVQPELPPRHPRHLAKPDLSAFLGGLGFAVSPYERRFHLRPQQVRLPALAGRPLAAPEFGPSAEARGLELFEVDALRLVRPVRQLRELRYQAFLRAPETRPSADLLFWYFFTQGLRSVILKDHYIPKLAYRLDPSSGDSEIHGGWELLSDDYGRLIRDAAERMPPACQAAGQGYYSAESLLRHCAEVVLHRLAEQVELPPRMERKVQGGLIDACRQGAQGLRPWLSGTEPSICQQWARWRRRLTGRTELGAINLVFRLFEADSEDASWAVEMRLAPRHDPSQHIALTDFWGMSERRQTEWLGLPRGEWEHSLLVALGQAARVYPPLWPMLDQAQPGCLELEIDAALNFLQTDAWVLEDAGFTVQVPGWWAPENRRRARLRLQTTGPESAAGSANRLRMDLNHLVAYRYQLALGEDQVNESEWQHLVESKSDLVRFRGRWLALDRAKMREMLEFWRRQRENDTGFGLADLIRKSAEDVDFFEVEPDAALADMLHKLRDRSRLQSADDPPGFGTQLRDYQKRGLAWIRFLESLGLNGCLADDMGLGKTVQVLARLVEERTGDAAGNPINPTLLVAPTSVLGSWRKEIERFAPALRAFIHHGAFRVRDQKEFAALCGDSDVVITSYALARKDQKLLGAVRWLRVVLDEAQNIKNPQSAQTRAVLALEAPHRLALTGTPVENRLLDLWSIFNFLNPGYLGRQSQFRQRFELPVQRSSDSAAADLLRRLVEPFVLRRVKTDPEIMRDLPDKVENKQFCHLCPEQAALYEAVVRDVERRLHGADGIGRQGLILSTLMRLKQICNHPAQFLGDGSAFTAARSPKLERLAGMLEEVIEEGHSALVFTQFSEIGAQLESYLRSELECPVYFLHGGVAAAQRQRMINDFQENRSGGGVFVLSLKAGGVGITLTRANHVFHFDRWWNPAVEDQATDRAFRIGQENNVFVHKFVTLGTLEERIDRLIEDKKQMASLVVGDSESWLSRLDNDTFRELIELNRMAVLD